MIGMHLLLSVQSSEFMNLQSNQQQRKTMRIMTSYIFQKKNCYFKIPFSMQTPNKRQRI
jgi:hypothetical protein